MIFVALVTRSIQVRRRRNAAFLAAVAAGTYVPPPLNGKRRDDPLLPKPMLWDAYISPGAPPHDPEKGWAEILVRTHNLQRKPITEHTLPGISP